ncbi:MAG: dockerin type I domain-containing protein [Ruminococcus sp.]|nr:dockerin type I domain-containing protein [Ruminococcus sp.]
MKRIKFKKMLSAFLAVTMIMTTFLSTTAFATTETETNSETKVYFEVPEFRSAPSRVYCHIYQVYGGKEITATPWQSKITKCDLVDEATNLYSFDTSKLCLEGDTSGYAIEEGADYGLIFSAVDSDGKSYQTCNLTFGSECLGDTVYVTKAELSGQDDATYNYIAEWRNNSDKYGEKAYITSTGIITGKYFPVNKPAEENVAEWLHSWAVLNEDIITVETVANICTQTGADSQAVYDKYAEIYSEELADIENNPTVASLERVSVLLGLENLVYVVAGSKELCGVNWVGDPTQAPQNVMTKVGDVYKKTFYDVEPCERIEFKIVECNYDNSMNWIGDMYDQTIVFANLSEGDVTITYNPETGEISYSGDCVEAVLPPHPYLSTMFVAGNGSGKWLNGEEWNPAAEANEMTEIADYVYQITFEDVAAGDNYQFKFAADGSWVDNWGGIYEGSGIESDAVYFNEENIVINVPYDNSDVTITLDLSNFNYATKEGAKFTVEVNAVGDVNNDDVLNVEDATMIMKYSVELVDETALNIDYADMNGNGRINVLDATAVQKYIAKVS